MYKDWRPCDEVLGQVTRTGGLITNYWDWKGYATLQERETLVQSFGAGGLLTYC